MGELYGGVETGGTWCVCAVGRGPGEMVAREQFRTGRPEETLEQIAAFFAGAPPVAAVGIGSFGPVDLVPDSPTWGHVTTTPKPGWKHVAIGPALRERLGVPIAFELDVTAAAVGEQRWGAGEGAGSLCYLTVGTGIGAGLLIDGVPRHGLVHPEVGHMRIPHDRARDPFDGCCPVHGDCWEGLAGGPAIAARWGTAPHRSWRPITRRGRSRPTTSPPGSSTSCSCSRPSASSSAGACSSIRRCSGRSGTRVVDLLGGYLDTPLLRAEEIETFLVPPALGDDAGVLGAIALAQSARARRGRNRQNATDRDRGADRVRLTCAERQRGTAPDAARLGCGNSARSAPGPGPRGRSARARRAREEHRGRVRAAVEHLDLHRLQFGGDERLLAGPGVARVARVGAGGDLEADPVPGGEAVPDRPQVERHLMGAGVLVVGVEPTGRDADERVGHVPRCAGGLDVAHAGEHVEVRPARADVQLHPDGPDRLDRLPQRLGREREHVGPCLEPAVIDDRVRFEQHRPADRRRRLGGVVDIPVTPDIGRRGTVEPGSPPAPR